MLKQHASSEFSDREVENEHGLGNTKELESIKTLKASDFEINISGFSENKTSSSVPPQRIQKTLTFHSKMKESKESDSSISFENVEELLDKKRSSFNYMKKWDDYRNQINSIYRGIVEKVMNFLLELGNFSLESFNLFGRSLREKANQEKNFGSANGLNEGELNSLKDNQFSNILKEIRYLENDQKRDHLEFASFIEQELLGKILGPNQAKYQSFMENFQKIENKMRQNLNKMRLITKEKFEDYATVFSEIMRFYLTNNKILKEKDLIPLENFYLYSVVENYNLLKVYSKEMKDIWYCLKKIELERIKEFEKIIRSYNQYEEKLYQFYPLYQDQIESIYDRLTSINPEKFIESLFDLSRILTTEQIQYLRQKYKIETCNELSVFEYLEQFEIRPLRKRPLLLGEFKAFERDSLQKSTSMNNSSLWKETKLLVSIDLNLIVLEDSSDLGFKPVKIIRLPLCTCIFNEEVGLATISEIKAKGISMNNVEKHQFKFSKEKELKDFKELIIKYIRKI